MDSLDATHEDASTRINEIVVRLQEIDDRLKEQGVSRYDIGREAFLEKAWEWKEEYAGFIRQQWEKMGLSLDYSRERFTLDE